MKHSQMQIEDCFWSPIISKMCNDIIPLQWYFQSHIAV